MTLEGELRAHLLRLGVWSVLSLVAGIVLLARDRAGGFGVMTLGWAVVNLAIVGFSLRSATPPDPEPFRRFLAFNLGLNLVWIAIGLAMWRNRGNAWVSSAGIAMAVQGTVLQVLDAILYARTPH